MSKKGRKLPSADINEEEALEIRRRVDDGERIQVVSGPIDEREVHLALVEQIARKHLDAAFAAIAEDIAVESERPWDAYVQERDRITRAIKESFKESWGNRQGRQQHISRERYVEEESWLDRMELIMAMTLEEIEEIEEKGINMPMIMARISAGPLEMGIDYAAEALAGELERELDRPPAASFLASLWRRRRGPVPRARRCTSE
jgi:hypothetical protein